VTTYDLEGLATSTSIDGPSGSVDAGTPVTLRGDLSVIGGDLGPARLVLERRTAHGGWAIVQGVDTVAGQPVELTVRPDATTTYRWELVDRPLAEGSASAPLTVQVNGSPGGSGGPSDQPAPSQQPTPSQSPTPSSHPTPSQHPTPSSTPKPTSTPTSTPTSKPTSTPTSKPTSKPTGQPTAGPTSAPTATPTGTPSAASSTLPSAGLSASASASPSTGGSAVPAP
jgi:outer membrane biosynthesis protein TonB